MLLFVPVSAAGDVDVVDVVDVVGGGGWILDSRATISCLVGGGHAIDGRCRKPWGGIKSMELSARSQ